MKLAISNIAWPFEHDAEVLDLIGDCGGEGVEVAPSKIWPNWAGSSIAAADAYRKSLEDRGLAIPALQAILFGKPELQVFEFESHGAFASHVTFVADLAQALGARTLVFGAPKNRRRESVAYQDAWPMAVDLFRKLGEICAQREVVIGMEPTPVEYACDFLTNLADIERFVQEVDSSGVAVHIDDAALHMTGKVFEQLQSLNSAPVHYHVSEPMLAPVGSGEVDHAAGIRALRDSEYSDWISIEMRQADPFRETIQTALTAIRGAIDHA